VLVGTIMNALIAALVGVIAFVVVKQIVSAQDTTGWSSAERAIIDAVPIAIGIMIVVGIFLGLTRLRGAGE